MQKKYKQKKFPKVKRLLFLLTAIVLMGSCKKDNGPDVFDFDISGVEKIDARIEESRTIQLVVTCNDAAPENVHLELKDVPEGIAYSFDKVSGTPEFATNLTLTVTRTVASGTHTLRLVGSSSSIIKEFPIEIAIDKSLSALFTVYNSLTYDPDNVRSNLLENAVIKLYKDHASFVAGIADYQQLTDSVGKARFYKLPPATYLYTIEKDNLTNVVQKRDVNGVKKGFVVAGLFRSKAEIVNSAQPTAQVGDLKFRDINADGKITDLDLGEYDTMSIYAEEMNEKVIWLGL
jgi:hypothetical protein